MRGSTLSQEKLNITLRFGAPYEDTGLRLWAIIHFTNTKLGKEQCDSAKAVFESLPSCGEATSGKQGKSILLHKNEDRSTWKNFEQEVLEAARKHFNVNRVLHDKPDNAQ